MRIRILFGPLSHQLIIFKTFTAFPSGLIIRLRKRIVFDCIEDEEAARLIAEEEGLCVETEEAAKLKAGTVDKLLASIASCFNESCTYAENNAIEWLKDPNNHPTSMSNVGEALTVARRVDAMIDTDAVVL